MFKKLFAALIFANCLLPVANCFSQAYVATTMVTGLSYPVAFDFLPNGDYLITLKGDGSTPAAANTAKIMMYSSTGSLISTFYNLSDSVQSNFERGLLGIEIDPNYSVNRYVYVYYNHRYAGDERIRIVRFTENANVGTNPTIIFDLDVSESIAGNHVGGNIRINPNEPDKMYFSIGDLAYQQTNQTLNYASYLTNPYGKMLRIGLTGPFPNQIPTDNPYYDDGNPATGNCDYIWSYGHRNHFDLSFSDVNDSLYSSENGLNTWDECNQIHKGGYYGWNYCEGNYLNSSTTNLCTLATDIPPIDVWAAPVPSVTGILHYSGTVFPTLTNHLLVADNDYGRIYNITLGNPPAWNTFVSRVQWGDFTTTGGLTTLMQGSEGCVYALKGGYTTNGQIYRICPPGLYADEVRPDYFSAGEPYPNPSSGNFEVEYDMPYGGKLNAELYDVAGRKITDIYNDQQSPGNHVLVIESKKLGLKAGTYLIKMNFISNNGGSFSSTKKLILED